MSTWLISFALPTSFFWFTLQVQMFNDTAVTTLLVELTLIARQWIVTSGGRIDLGHFAQLEIIRNVFHMMLSVWGPSTHLQPALWVWKAANTTVSTIEMEFFRSTETPQLFDHEEKFMLVIYIIIHTLYIYIIQYNLYIWAPRSFVALTPKTSQSRQCGCFESW